MNILVLTLERRAFYDTIFDQVLHGPYTTGLAYAVHKFLGNRPAVKAVFPLFGDGFQGLGEIGLFNGKAW